LFKMTAQSTLATANSATHIFMVWLK